MKLLSHLVIDNRPVALLQINALIEQYCRDYRAHPELEQALLLLAEEVHTNIVNHGYTDTTEHRVEFKLYHDAQRVMLEFKDDGVPFNPLQQPQAELGLPVVEAAIGGLGLTMIRQLSDTLSYQRTGKYNILSLLCNTGQQPTNNSQQRQPTTTAKENTMSLELDISEQQPQVRRVRLTGRLDTMTAPQLDAALAPVLADTHMLVLDMESLDYISSAGLRSIFKATKSLKNAGGRVGVLNMQPQIRKVFDIVKAMPDVPIFKDDAEMDQYLDAMQRKILDGED